MDKWDKAYKKILIKESGIYGYNNNPYRVREQAPPVPEQGQGGQETGFSDEWSQIKDQVSQFVQQSLQDIYSAIEDPDKQNELVNRVIGPAIKQVLLGNPQANIPYKEIHNLMGGSEEPKAPEGGEEAPAAGGEAPMGGAAPAGGEAPMGGGYPPEQPQM